MGIRGLIKATAVFVLALAGGSVTGLVFAHESVTGFTPAGPDAATYELSDFVVQYPFEDTLSGVNDPTRAGIRFSSSWRGEYPGASQCVVTLRDAHGAEVGMLDTEWDSLQRVTSLPTFQPVDVSSEPVSAEGACAAGDYDPDAGDYQFAQVNYRAAAVAVSKSAVAVDAMTSWTGSSPPGTRDCTATATLTDGSKRSFSFTLDAPNGRRIQVTTLQGVAADAITDVTITCSAFEE